MKTRHRTDFLCLRLRLHVLDPPFFFGGFGPDFVMANPPGASSADATAAVDFEPLADLAASLALFLSCATRSSISRLIATNSGMVVAFGNEVNKARDGLNEQNGFLQFDDNGLQLHPFCFFNSICAGLIASNTLDAAVNRLNTAAPNDGALVPSKHFPKTQA
jgi:hypothetical protein